MNNKEEQPKVDYDEFITSLKNKINLLGIIPAEDYNMLQSLLRPLVTKSSELKDKLEKCGYDLFEKTYKRICKKDESIFVFVDKNLYPKRDRMISLDPDTVNCKHQGSCTYLKHSEYKCIFKRT